MKKVEIVFLIILTVSVSSYGSGKGEYRGSTDESFVYRFSINASNSMVNNKLFVSERVMKKGFPKYKKRRQEDLTIFPLFNLDIYVQDGNIRKNIKEFHASVPVTISKEFIQKTTGLKMTTNYNLYVYLNEKKQWVPIGSHESGIIDVVINRTTINFTVVGWPVDDMMIGSGR